MRGEHRQRTAWVVRPGGEEDLGSAEHPVPARNDVFDRRTPGPPPTVMKGGCASDRCIRPAVPQLLWTLGSPDAKAA
jgi:hypothetical protein